MPVLDKEGNVVGVFDLDSPNFEQFDEDDKAGLEQIAEIVSKQCNWDICKTK